MTASPFQRLTVIGLGLIGGSLAMAARERFPEMHIQAVDSNPESLQYAIRHRFIDKALLALPPVLEDNHLVVIATHLSDSLEVLRALAPRVAGQDVVVTDVGSCKRQIWSLGKEILPDCFLAGHPMAGREFSGIENATSLLFAGKPYLFCPHDTTDPVILERLERFVRGLGATPRCLDPDTHDRYMAYVSHLPQLYAILLTNLLYRHEPAHLLSYHGGGLDDQLRLAASPYAMWKDVFAFNADNLGQVLSELQQMLGEIRPLLEPDRPELRTWFEHSNEVHREFHAIRLTR